MDAEQPIAGRVAWLAIGDWGEDGARLQQLADGMAKYAESFQPHFIMSCGDNFYPNGCNHVVHAPGTRKAHGPLKRGDAFTSYEFNYWAKTFLKHASLRVPWKVVLGNHDYGGSVEAQYFFTDSAMNPSGLWQCRGDDTSEAPGRCFTFSRPLTASATPDPRSTVQFFAFDANACQYAVRRAQPNILNMYEEDVKWLDRQCKQHSDALWKIQFQHHPLYTQGKGHHSESVCLRKKDYLSAMEATKPGLDLERHVHRLGIDAIFSGHEHMMQHKTSTAESGHTCFHVCCGATVDSVFYGGAVKERVMDWYQKGPCGFVAAEIVTDAVQSMLRVRWIEMTELEVIHTHEVVKQLATPE